jgi:signal transduction histidine kinase
MLSEAATLAQWFIAEGIGPMDIKGIHEAAVASLIADDDAEALVGAHRFLLEVLFAYGAAYSALSERLLAEADAADLARSEEAEQAERDRLELLAGVSHELGNPLMIVKVNVASIRKFLEERGNWPEDLSQREADVEFAVDRMLSLREELLAASRNEQRELEVVAMPLGHVLRRVVRWARMSAADKSIELVEDHSADLPYVMADDGALQSIFTNLLSNAIRYTKSGGTVKVTGTAEGAEVVVTVADTGIGISEDEQLHIYERFYRTDEAKRVVSFGVGLGLAITRDLVSALSGTIKVASEPGVGSTFRVSLPLAQELKKDVT